MGRGWLTAENSLVKYANRNDANGYYKALGLPPDAGREEIKAAYWKLAKKLHPDLGGDEELFRFVADIASVLLDDESKGDYDSVGHGFIYLGNMEREQLARSGFKTEIPKQKSREKEPDNHWACLTDSGFYPGEDTDTWTYFCRQVAPAVGYRGKIRVGVIEGGRSWPFDPYCPWGVLTAGSYTFVVFQRGIEPTRLYALCAMIDLQSHLLNQVRHGWVPTQNRERAS